MTEKHGFTDTLKHMVFEDEPEKPEKTASTTATIPHTSPPAASAVQSHFAPPASYEPAQPIDAGTVLDNDPVYQRILAKTDFEGTDVAATIHRFLDPLKAISDTVMPPNVKFKTAVVQAQAQAGLTDEAILSAFDKLKALLEQEQQAFETKAQQFAAREISDRQARIAQITSQISELQQELGRLSSELVDAQGKGSHAQGQFSAAAQRRAIEIEQQKAQYAALLKG
jgi:hypothetical protein